MSKYSHANFCPKLLTGNLITELLYNQGLV